MIRRSLGTVAASLIAIGTFGALAAVPAGGAEPGRTCSGAKQIGQVAAGGLGPGGRIRSASSVSAVYGDVQQPLGFIYETVAGRRYFQTAAAIVHADGGLRTIRGPGPVVAFAGDVRAALRLIATSYRVRPRELPAPYGAVGPRTPIVASHC